MRRRLAILAAAALLSGCMRAFFQPSRALILRPERFGYRYEAVRFPSEDGTELTGLLFSAPAGPAKGAVVHFHGNGENMTSHFLSAAWLAREGFHVLVFDYRGYGASGGQPGMAGAVADGAAALAWMRARFPEQAGRLAVFGQSLGGALAVAAAAREPVGVRAVVLDSSFDSFRGVARDRLASAWPTWPLQWLAWVAVSDAYSPRREMRRLPKAPVLVVHGEDDPVVPQRFGRRLFELAPEPKAFWSVPGRGHARAFAADASPWRARLVGFLEEALR
jgi:fermentation-respiration switch protein FrsA (DUF1100 family)